MMTIPSTTDVGGRTASVGVTLLAGLPLFTLLPLGLDIFLPAVYQIGEYFGNDTVAALAISIYMLFWGLGQLFWGAMADRLGKRTIALLGLGIFAFASLLIAHVGADSGSAFLSYRALQAFGGSACFTAIFALIRMRFDGAELNQAYSYLNGILAFIPVSAPLLGAYIIESHSWFTLFTLMAVLAAGSLLWVWFGIERDHGAVAKVNQPALFSGYGAVIGNQRFRHYLALALTAQGLFIYFLSVAPSYLMGQLGLGQIDFGQMFMVIALVFMAMSFASPKLNQRFAIRRLLAIGLLLIMAGALLMLALSHWLTWLSLIGPMVLIAAGCTILLSSCPANALADFKAGAGSASGLYTATTFGGGAIASGIVVSQFNSANLSVVAVVYLLGSAAALLLLMRSPVLRKDATA